MAGVLSKISPRWVDGTPASKLHVASSSPTPCYISNTLETIPCLLVLLICAWTAVFGRPSMKRTSGRCLQCIPGKNPYFLIPCLESQLCQQLRTPDFYSWVQQSRCAVWAHFLGMKLTKTCNQEAWVLLELTLHCMNNPCPMKLLSSIWKGFTWFHTSWWHETESVISYFTVERSRKLLIFFKKIIFWKFYLFERETKSMRQEREIMNRGEG